MAKGTNQARLHPGLNGTPYESPCGTPSLEHRKRRPSHEAIVAGLMALPTNAQCGESWRNNNPDQLLPPTDLVRSRSPSECGDRPRLPLPGESKNPSSPDIPTVTVVPPKESSPNRNASKTEEACSPEIKKDESTSSIGTVNESPVFQDDGFFEDSDEEYSGNDPWDMATVIPKESISAGESFAGILKFIRLFMYVAIFVLVWVFSTASMGSFLFLTASLKKDEMYRHAARNHLIWIICVPQLFIFIFSFIKTVFGNYPRPTAKIFLLVLLLELMHTFGLILIVFHVLPHFGAIYCIGLMNSLSIVPGLLSIFFNGTLKGKSMMRKFIVKFLDVLAVVATVGVILLPFLMKALYKLRDYSGYPSDKDHNHMLEEKYLIWQIPLGFVLVSVKWWENFVGVDTGCLRLYQLKKAVHNARNKLSVFTSVVSILFTFGCVWFLDRLNYGHLDFKETFDPTYHHNTTDLTYCANVTREKEVTITDNDRNVTGSDNITVSDSSSTQIELEYYVQCVRGSRVDSIEQYAPGYIPVIVCTGASLIVYYCCGLATKLMMQRWSSALPLLLASPTVAVIVVLQCKDIIPEMPITSGLQYEFLCDVSSDVPIYYMIAAIFSWISLLWTTRHMWFPKIERLSHYERIFVTKMFTGPLVAQCIMLNRRNDEQDMNLVGKATNEELDVLYKRVNGNRTVDGSDTNKPSSRPTPMVYACATMWHENRNEMVQLLKSIYRMDSDFCARRIAKSLFGIQDPDLYDFETHVLFDDAMELDDDDKWTVNKFVLELKNCMQEAASAVLHQDVPISPPKKWATPYGGRLTWLLPGGTNLVVHLKDKNKIRHRKRWSQVMYMYYLLGYRLFDEVPAEMKETVHKKDSLDSNGSASTSGVSSDNTGLRKRSGQVGGEGRKNSAWMDLATQDKGQTDRFMRSEIFKNMEESLIVKTENTFILALDGDVDFKPDAVRLLLDRMRINPKTGAACGRIHPIGSSPMVWYQKFEYAIGHWFQKSTEHVLGCVLCSPGCFSLFRASALLDDNVMKRYTTEPTEPGDFLQYDQGEDRWLCTLLLQQGYRVDYAAASDALTYAPETFDEFFNQRRRWTPSTIANIIDLLSDASNTVLVNPNISTLYIFYQFFLMVSTVLGPATIILAIASAFRSVFAWKLWECYLASIAPVVFYLIICFKCKTKTQLLIGAFLSVMYAAIMTVVLVGIIQAIVLESIFNPSLLFLVVVVICFVFAGLIHPYEFTVLFHGILYFLCIPAGYLVLMIYSMCNLHNVSWGTREIPKRKSKAQQAAEAAAAAAAAKNKKNKQGGWFSVLKVDAFLDKLKDILTQVLNKNKDNNYQENMVKMMARLDKSMKRMVKQQKKANGNYVDSDSSDDEDEKSKKKKDAEEKKDELVEIEIKQPEVIVVEEVKLDDPTNPNWLKDQRLGNGKVERLNKHEEQFWHQLIRRYLKPLKKDVAKEKQLAAGLITLRNNSAFGFWFVNFLWVLFNYMIQKDSNLSSVDVGSLKTEPIGFVFLIFFLLILVLQVLGMIIHRWGTLLQLISITEIQNILSKAFAHSAALISFTTDNDAKKHATTEELVRFISHIQHDPEPVADYPTDIPNDDSIYAEVRDIVEQHKKQTPRNQRETVVNMEPPLRDNEGLSHLFMQGLGGRGEPSHKRAIHRNLNRNINQFRREENRKQHRVRLHGHGDLLPQKRTHLLNPGRRPSVDVSSHHVEARATPQDRRPSQGLLHTLHEHRDDARWDMTNRRSPQPQRKLRRPQNHRHQPRHTPDHPQLEMQFLRRFHRMNSQRDSRI